MVRKRPTKGTKAYVRWRAKVDRKNAHKEWALAVKARDGNRCAICGSTGLLNAHHILPAKAYPKLRTDGRVGILLCIKCHKWSRKAAHSNGFWFTCWMMEHRPRQFEFCKAHMDDVKR